MNRPSVTVRPTAAAGNRSGGRARKVWLLVLLGVVVAVVGAAQAAGSPSRPSTALFGCSEQLGPMVIANVDCQLGVAVAFAHVEPVVSPGASVDRLGVALAPWCDQFADRTIYGCASTVVDIDRAVFRAIAEDGPIGGNAG